MNIITAPNNSLTYRAPLNPRRLNIPPNAGSVAPTAMKILPIVRCNNTRFRQKIQADQIAPPTNVTVPYRLKNGVNVLTPGVKIA